LAHYWSSVNSPILETYLRMKMMQLIERSAYCSNGTLTAFYHFLSVDHWTLQALKSTENFKV
jgi:hypothetical protein